LLFNAAPMHDVGKIGIPDSILLKPGPLNAAEWDVMRRHPEIGAAIIGDDASDLLRMSRDIARCHHEQWDGSGYPQGLAGDAIPLAARIVTVADVFDALTTARPYKLAWRKADAIAYIVQQAGRQFDPDAVAAFTAVLDRIEETMERYKETGPSPPAYGHPTLKGRGDLVGSAGGRRTQGFSAA
jgi:putative two-component system response regulator